MSYRVVIPTAGTGSRLKSLTQYINKSLVSVSNRPTISHQIEMFPSDCEFVIALGHKGQLVRDFLELAYPERTFFFSNVDNFEGEGSGLGLSLLSCQQYLQQPFIFLSCDTLVTEPIPSPDSNWMGYAQVDNLNSYRTVQLTGEYITEICEKGIIEDNIKAYIGLAGVHDYQIFWDYMVEGGGKAVEQGESYGLREIINKSKILPYNFTWFDTGTLDKLDITRKAYKQLGEPNILEKENEAIWFVGENVIKYSDDKNFIQNRVIRTKEIQDFIPKIYASRDNMYCYKKVEGDVLSSVITLPLFDKFIQHAQIFWRRHSLNNDQSQKFKRTCLKFYKDKTLERVQLFYDNFDKTDGLETVNGEQMPLLSDLLKSIDWEWISDGLAGRFHGDFHFENILWSEQQEEFTFLDWRQDFGGDLSIGDIYYDLAKLMHGLIVSHELVANNHYTVKWDRNKIQFDLHRKQILVECEQQLNQWILDNNYDLKKVRVLTALIYLNIAALHHHPYSLLLYGLGKEMLKRELI